ncbi:MAG: hypothetical protein EXS09_14305 [Gemmataceae bacterium]|nr:hypothetical protein [Gemmataceae bacterium]
MFKDWDFYRAIIMMKWMLAALVAAGLAGAEAQAQGPGMVGGGGYAEAGGSRFSLGRFWSRSFFGSPSMSSSQNLTRMPTLPVFMAAPWYLYYPYDGHFQTVAPPAQNPAFYPPPTYTGNPYLSGRYPGYVPNNPVPESPMLKK